MYALTDEQIDYILNDIKTRGVEMEDLQLNLLDHICCIVECELPPDGDFTRFYQQIIPRFFKKELKEIEEETILLLTFKNYYAMKKVMITSGIFSVITFIAGSFFKIMHWPGASPLLLLGMTSMSFLFLPLMFLLKIKDVNSNRDKLVAGIGTLTGILTSLFILFKVMHWPGANVMGFTALCIFFFIFIPVYFFTGIRHPERKLNTIVTTIILIGVAGLQYTLVNLRPSYQQTEVKMYVYQENEELLKMMQPGRVDTARMGQEINQQITDINNIAGEMKKLILQNMTGKPTVSKDFENDGTFLEDVNAGVAFEPGNAGEQLFIKFRDAIKKYNDSVPDQQNKIPADHFDGRLSPYNGFVVLDYLVQTQMYIAATNY